MTSTLQNLVVSCTAVCLLNVLGCSTPQGVTHSHAASEVRTSSTPSASSACTANARGLDSVYEAGFEAPYFALRVELDAAATTLTVEGTEKNPRTSEYDDWDMVEHHHGSVIERVAMRHANEWYLALRLPGGSVEIERWKLNRTTGAYFSGRRAALSGIGTATATAALAVSIEGGSYIQPSDRPRPGITKATVATGLALDAITTMVVDPDGRYLVLELAPSTGARQLVQVAIMPSASPGVSVGDVIPLWDFSTITEFPGLASIAQLEHASLGRALVVRDLETSVCRWDQDNDGVFEGTETFQSLGEWTSKYPLTTWSHSY